MNIKMSAIHYQLSVPFLLLALTTNLCEAQFTMSLTSDYQTNTNHTREPHRHATDPYTLLENSTAPLHIANVYCQVQAYAFYYNRAGIPLTYGESIWFFNGIRITNGSHGFTVITDTVDGGAVLNGEYRTGSKLVWPSRITSDLTGNYTCAMGRVSRTFRIRVKVPAMVVYTTPTQVVKEGSAVSLDCRYRGDEPMTTTWFFKGTQVAAFVSPQPNSLSIGASSLAESGNYTCTVSNAIRNDTRTIQLTVTRLRCTDDPFLCGLNTRCVPSEHSYRCECSLPSYTLPDTPAISGRQGRPSECLNSYDTDYDSTMGLGESPTSANEAMAQCRGADSNMLSNPLTESTTVTHDLREYVRFSELSSSARVWVKIQSGIQSIGFQMFYSLLPPSRWGRAHSLCIVPLHKTCGSDKVWFKSQLGSYNHSASHKFCNGQLPALSRVEIPCFKDLIQSALWLWRRPVVIFWTQNGELLQFDGESFGIITPPPAARLTNVLRICFEDALAITTQPTSPPAAQPTTQRTTQPTRSPTSTSL
eukprot:scpid73071/ scgid2768/ Hemicentin-2